MRPYDESPRLAHPPLAAPFRGPARMAVSARLRAAVEHEGTEQKWSVVAMTIRPDWRSAFGPLDLRMPVDPSPTMPDWAAVKGPANHEDSQDSLNADGTWGPADPGAPGGSGIVMGYACSDIDAVIRAEEAVWRRPVRYDFEHWIRQIRYALTAWEMARDLKYTRRLIAYDSMARGVLTDNELSVHLDDPSWIPFTLAQFHALALARPHQGLDYPFNGRAVGWIAYGHAMRRKVNPDYPKEWARMLLRTCELAAIEGTGQVCADTNGYAKPTVYLSHQGILLHGVLALCHQLCAPPPDWAYDWMDSVEALPRVPYYGQQSPLKFCYSDGGKLVPEKGYIQGGDPAYAYWSSNCVALARLSPAHRVDWMRRAARIGPTTAGSEDGRKASMLYRGEIQQ